MHSFPELRSYNLRGGGLITQSHTHDFLLAEILISML